MSETTGPRRLKFIFFPLGWVLAHVTRLVEIGKILRDRGHEVILAGENPDEKPKSKLAFARQAGFRVAYAEEPNFPYAWARFEKHGWLVSAYDVLTYSRWAPIDRILESQIRLIEAEKPDMVVGDATTTVSVAAYITGIPAAGVLNAYATEFMRMTSPFKPVIHLFDNVQLARHRRKVYRKYGIKPLNGVQLLETIPLISPDLPGMYEPAARFPNWHMVGPIIAQPTLEKPAWWDELDDGRTNVYVTMGSTGILDTFLQRTYDALGKAPYRFLLTTAGQAKPETLRMAPPNFRIAEYAPGSELLEHCAGLIFHGGNGTMYQALAAGVPMIGVPTHLEQRINFVAARKHGFGIQFGARRINGAALARGLEHILQEPKFRLNAQRFTEAVKNSHGAVEAANIIERAALEGKPAGGALR
jgi:UDP:flavonoid glycosyltransferase YjiC (YdhE family)